MTMYGGSGSQRMDCGRGVFRSPTRGGRTLPMLMLMLMPTTARTSLCSQSIVEVAG